jgi:uncharacterized protein (TIGR00251 family)
VIDYTETDDALIFNVKVVPRASKSEIAGELDGALKIRLAAAPVDGAANAELIKFLAREFGVPKSQVKILSGHVSKSKRVKISGVIKNLPEIFLDNNLSRLNIKHI